MTSPTTWCQANLAFHDWDRAEATALTHLAPLLRAAEDTQAVAAWFFIRKHPCWRLRYLPGTAGEDRLEQGLDALIADGHITGWTEIVYEPEVHAFGGAESMASGHRFFHRDSRAMLEQLQGDRARYRREVSLALCSLLLRAAGLDWYEQGDVWARVAAHRKLQPAADQHDRDRRDRLRTAVHRLISVNAEELMQAGGPLADTADWARAYTGAGHELHYLTQAGKLQRGLRHVLAHHVIFAWNRIGLPYTTQAALADAAKTVIFGPDPTLDRSADRAHTP
ncbi:thiopeptide-type bacteriocin biosynthesis protein [Streptomyces sp. NPDC017964]|uniref:thiopeptide-type bacteriocin biosynthesis protein n=1 Tax=Streptomyces sp. NPDC017964 TaxID=3365022 RepID=UPI003787EFF0